MTQLFAAVTRSGALGQIRHLTAVQEAGDDPTVATVYRAMEREFGMLAPPVALHAPNPPLLAAAWAMLRETLLVRGAAPREAKETAAAAVSLANQCPYCVEVHGSTLDGLLSDRVLANGVLELGDRPELVAVARWAGLIGDREAALRPQGAVAAGSAAELLSVAVTFHYLNRVVNVFLADSPVPSGLPVFMRSTVKRLLTKLASTLADRDPRPGDSLVLLPEAALPEDLAWTGGHEHLAGAFARAGAAIDTAATDAVPPEVRRLVSDRLADWDGQPPATADRSWLDQLVTRLPRECQAAGRLALLTAFASYRVTDDDVESLRTKGYEDAELVALVSWSAFAAARQIGRWHCRID